MHGDYGGSAQAVPRDEARGNAEWTQPDAGRATSTGGLLVLPLPERLAGEWRGMMSWARGRAADRKSYMCGEGAGGSYLFVGGYRRRREARLPVQSCLLVVGMDANISIRRAVRFFVAVRRPNNFTGLISALANNYRTLLLKEMQF